MFNQYASSRKILRVQMFACKRAHAWAGSDRLDFQAAELSTEINLIFHFWCVKSSWGG